MRYGTIMLYVWMIIWLVNFLRGNYLGTLVACGVVTIVSVTRAR